MEHWKKHENIPLFMRPAIGTVMDAAAKSSWRLLADTKTQEGVAGWRRLGAKLEKRARRIGAKSSLELFVRMMTRYKDIGGLVKMGEGSQTILTNKDMWPNHADPILNMMLMDTICYLPDDILVKVDRASMATSLEVRSPLLDKETAEFSWSLPYEMKVNQYGGKRILKDVLGKYLPTELTDRKKMGFGVPMGKWIRSPLRDWAEDLLDVNKIKQQGYLNETKVQTLWRQHQSGWRNHNDILWSILMFQAWLENNT
jgi:asparagine synthase (glutamine-hydrolysing)